MMASLALLFALLVIKKSLNIFKPPLPIARSGGCSFMLFAPEKSWRGEAAGLWGAAALYLAGLRSPSPARRFFPRGIYRFSEEYSFEQLERGRLQSAPYRLKNTDQNP